MRRPTWLAAGVVLGVGGTLWAEQRLRRRVRQAVQRLSPEQVAGGAVDSVRQLGDRVRVAVETGRQERERRETELRDDLADRWAPRHARPPARRPVTSAPAGAWGRRAERR
jgi:hypothetical protein